MTSLRTLIALCGGLLLVCGCRGPYERPVSNPAAEHERQNGGREDARDAGHEPEIWSEGGGGGAGRDRPGRP